MWFVEGPRDDALMPVEGEEGQRARNRKRMWLVKGPSDERPMPISASPTSQSAGKGRKRTGPASAAESCRAPRSAKRGCSAADRAEQAVKRALGMSEEEMLPELRAVDMAAPVRLALIGATGLVGRACAGYLAAHPELGFTVPFYVGSALSTGKALSEVAGQKEAKLQEHYGEGFWQSSDEAIDPEASVTDVDALLAAGPQAVDVVLSFLAPRFGHLEDQMIKAGFRLVSISPHARMQHPLIIPFVNGRSVDFGSLRCIKSPNCCSVGSTVALRPLVEMFDVQEIFITTFQTLSGRGDALYPADKVVANVYPIGATEERTEEYIAQEVARVYKDHPRASCISKDSIHVSAYRVYVQKNHLLDIKVRVAETLPLASAKSMLAAVYSQVQYSSDVAVSREVGEPRPRSHAHPNRVVVGNFDVEPAAGGKGSLVRVSVTVDNVAKGAFGNALDIAQEIVHALGGQSSSSSVTVPSGRADPPLPGDPTETAVGAAPQDTTSVGGQAAPGTTAPVGIPNDD